MRIGLSGYGRMGKAVEKQALTQGHEVVVINPYDLPDALPDCVIDFSHAASAPQVIRDLLSAGVPVVSGTTGMLESLPALRNYCTEVNGAFLWSPNFSVGMQVTFHVNRVLARLTKDHGYTPHILEIHHTGKQDSPSGTAIALAQQLISELEHKTHWVNAASDDPDAIEIESQRTGDEKGIHRVSYHGPFDTISLRHHALSRDGFAAGAVLAAEWLLGRSGCFEFKDVLDFKGRV